jgi:hypothetical protein
MQNDTLYKCAGLAKREAKVAVNAAMYRISIKGLAFSVNVFLVKACLIIKFKY